MDLRDITILSLGIVIGVVISAIIMAFAERLTTTRFGLMQTNIIAYVVVVAAVLIYNKWFVS